MARSGPISKCCWDWLTRLLTHAPDRLHLGFTLLCRPRWKARVRRIRPISQLIQIQLYRAEWIPPHHSNIIHVDHVTHFIYQQNLTLALRDVIFVAQLKLCDKKRKIEQSKPRQAPPEHETIYVCDEHFNWNFVSWLLLLLLLPSVERCTQSAQARLPSQKPSLASVRDCLLTKWQPASLI